MGIWEWNGKARQPDARESAPPQSGIIANIMQLPMIVIYTALITLCNNFSLLVATHPSHTERRINSTYNMDDVTHHHGDR